MGYFANLYVVEVSEQEDQTYVTTSIYGGDIGDRAYFSWGPGEREGELHPYANGTLFSDTEMRLLRGYPLLERYEVSEPFLLEADFRPRHKNDPVLIHIVLHNSYVPMRNRSPFIQPCEPSVYKQDNRIVITYPLIGATTIRFWVSPIQEGVSLDDYDMTRIMQPEVKHLSKTTFKFNFGIFGVEREIVD